MAVYRHVHTSFWQDAKVVEEMTPEDRYFYLYLLTNPSTTQIGIYPITKKQMAFELGYSMESVKSLLDRFQNHHGVVIYNEETREIALINWGKYNFNRGGKPVEDCVIKELKEVKDKTLIAVVAENITNERIKALFLEHLQNAGLDDTSHDTSDDTYHDTSTTRGQKEKEKEKQKEKQKEKESNTPENGQREKENLCSLEDIEAFVESHMASNPLPVNKKLLVKYIDCLRLTRKTARISTKIIKDEWQKWAKFPQSVITYAMWTHVEKHDDKREEYTLGIMRRTTESEANKGLKQLLSKANSSKEVAPALETAKLPVALRNQEQASNEPQEDKAGRQEDIRAKIRMMQDRLAKVAQAKELS